jgi:preprotein translocase subunit SecE
VTTIRGDAKTAPQPKPTRSGRGGPAARLSRFIREVIAELGKVIWPTRKELITYTTVVIVFVSIMVALVSGLDIAFAKGVLAVFG